MRNQVTGSGFIRWLQASWQSARWAGRTNGHWFFNKGPPSCQPTVPHRYPSSWGSALSYLTGGSYRHSHTAHLPHFTFILTEKQPSQPHLEKLMSFSENTERIVSQDRKGHNLLTSQPYIFELDVCSGCVAVPLFYGCRGQTPLMCPIHQAVSLTAGHC